MTVVHWREWVARWDRMQARYLVGRAERFAVIARLVRETQGPAPRIVDLGCGPGSLSAALLDALRTRIAANQVLAAGVA